MYEIGISRHLT